MMPAAKLVSGGGAKSKFRFSLNVKLAAMVAILLIALGGIVFQQLTQREYGHLVEAKRVAGVMVTTLAAASLGASVEFGETDDIKEQLEKLAATPSVSGAAVYVGNEGAPRAHMDQRAVPALIEQPEVVGVDRIAVLRPILGKQGEALATLVIEFSLAEENQQYQDGRRRLILFVVAFSVTIAILMLLVVGRLIIRPLQRLAAAAHALQEGKKVDVPVARNDEIGDLARAFDSMGAAVIERHERLQKELALAVRIQTSILPRNFKVEGYEIAANMWPATEVGGDYYDLIPARDGCWLGIGDVSGHGLDTGLVMLMIQSVVAGLVTGGAESPSVVVNGLNRVLFENIRSRLLKDDHATLTMLRVSGDGGVTFAGAHEELVVWRAKTQTCETIPTPGTWVGAAADISRHTTDSQLVLEPGDALLLYTDGATESRNSKGVMFGIERLSAALASVHTLAANAIVEELHRVVHQWTSVQDDDISLLVVKRLPAV